MILNANSSIPQQPSPYMLALEYWCVQARKTLQDYTNDASSKADVQVPMGKIAFPALFPNGLPSTQYDTQSYKMRSPVFIPDYQLTV